MASTNGTLQIADPKPRQIESQDWPRSVDTRLPIDPTDLNERTDRVLDTDPAEKEFNDRQWARVKEIKMEWRKEDAILEKELEKAQRQELAAQIAEENRQEQKVIALRRDENGMYNFQLAETFGEFDLEPWEKPLGGKERRDLIHLLESSGAELLDVASSGDPELLLQSRVGKRRYMKERFVPDVFSVYKPKSTGKGLHSRFLAMLRDPSGEGQNLRRYERAVFNDVRHRGNYGIWPYAPHMIRPESMLVQQRLEDFDSQAALRGARRGLLELFLRICCTGEEQRDLEGWDTRTFEVKAPPRRKPIAPANPLLESKSGLPNAVQVRRTPIRGYQVIDWHKDKGGFCFNPRLEDAERGEMQLHDYVSSNVLLQTIKAHLIRSVYDTVRSSVLSLPQMDKSLGADSLVPDKASRKSVFEFPGSDVEGMLVSLKWRTQYAYARFMYLAHITQTIFEKPGAWRQCWEHWYRFCSEGGVDGLQDNTAHEERAQIGSGLDHYREQRFLRVWKDGQGSVRGRSGVDQIQGDEELMEWDRARIRRLAEDITHARSRALQMTEHENTFKQVWKRVKKQSYRTRMAHAHLFPRPSVQHVSLFGDQLFKALESDIFTDPSRPLKQRFEARLIAEYIGFVPMRGTVDTKELWTMALQECGSWLGNLAEDPFLDNADDDCSIWIHDYLIFGQAEADLQERLELIPRDGEAAMIGPEDDDIWAADAWGLSQAPAKLVAGDVKILLAMISEMRAYLPPDKLTTDDATFHNKAARLWEFPQERQARVEMFELLWQHHTLLSTTGNSPRFWKERPFRIVIALEILKEWGDKKAAEPVPTRVEPPVQQPGRRFGVLDLSLFGAPPESNAPETNAIALIRQETYMPRSLESFMHSYKYRLMNPLQATPSTTVREELVRAVVGREIDLKQLRLPKGKPAAEPDTGRLLTVATDALMNLKALEIVALGYVACQLFASSICSSRFMQTETEDGESILDTLPQDEGLIARARDTAAMLLPFINLGQPRTGVQHFVRALPFDVPVRDFRTWDTALDEHEREGQDLDRERVAKINAFYRTLKTRTTPLLDLPTEDDDVERLEADERRMALAEEEKQRRRDYYAAMKRAKEQKREYARLMAQRREDAERAERLRQEADRVEFERSLRRIFSREQREEYEAREERMQERQRRLPRPAFRNRQLSQT